RDPDLGKVVLYQLSYFRVWQGVFVVCDAKVGTIFELAKSFCRFFCCVLPAIYGSRVSIC
ncbi:hypothetical protein, partial [Muribaculum intestinale]|uniref:hypothetical protein n=1 Tax=Muribaculum intestinale TaxID=1796646 RepID=UPI002431BCF2